MRPWSRCRRSMARTASLMLVMCAACVPPSFPTSPSICSSLSRSSSMSSSEPPPESLVLPSCVHIASTFLRSRSRSSLCFLRPSPCSSSLACIESSLLLTPSLWSRALLTLCSRPAFLVMSRPCLSMASACAPSRSCSVLTDSPRSLSTRLVSSAPRPWLLASLASSRSTPSPSSCARSALSIVPWCRTARSSCASLSSTRPLACTSMPCSAWTMLPFRPSTPAPSCPRPRSSFSTAAMQCWWRSLALARACLVVSRSLSTLPRASASFCISTRIRFIQLVMLLLPLRRARNSLSTLWRVAACSSTFESVTAWSLAMCASCCFSSRSSSESGSSVVMMWCRTKLIIDSSPPFRPSSTGLPMSASSGTSKGVMCAIPNGRSPRAAARHSRASAGLLPCCPLRGPCAP
mmetsp:Transcript_96307/g.272298  ORF Transcript_96307/g.272298 Transcript_96307/m.272298 type:complete len:406 (+) Transcript_96307:488-1705(+)